MKGVDFPDSGEDVGLPTDGARPARKWLTKSDKRGAPPPRGLKTYLHPVLLTSRIVLRFFLSPSGRSGQNDKKGRLGQNDEEGFLLEKIPSFRPARWADRDKKTPQTNII